MFDTKSDYALNKSDKNSIVYTGNDGYECRITKEDFASEEEFQFWKSWSDENYRLTDNADTYYQRHIVVLNTVDGKLSVLSPEDSLIDAIAQTEQDKHNTETILAVKSILSEKQFRRLWLRYALGLKVRAIAKIEGVTHPKIVKSIQSAVKIILKNTGSEGTKMP